MDPLQRSGVGPDVTDRGREEVPEHQRAGTADRLRQTIRGAVPEVDREALQPGWPVGRPLTEHRDDGTLGGGWHASRLETRP